MYAYVGSRTTRERNARGEGISVFRVIPGSGALEHLQTVGGLVNPSYLCLSDDGTRLYAVHGDQQDASAFRIDRATGRLELLNQQSTGGLNPVHLDLSPEGRHLVVTNHIGATVVVLPIGADGCLESPSQTVVFDGTPGPHRIEQKQAKPHFSLFDPSRRVVVVPDKGLDRVFSFRWRGDHLVAAEPPSAASREGAGPRSVAFHPRLPLSYVVNELDSTVTTYEMDYQTGAMKPLHWLPTLPATFTGDSRAAGIEVDPAGRTLYTSNRGHDSLAVFRLDAATGLPALLDVVPSGGRTPRFFTLSSDGSLLWALNEESDTIVAFHVDPDTGKLTPSGSTTRCGSPVCMVFSS